MGVPRFDPEAVGTQYIYVAMADHIQARIESGELPPLTRLPAERALAEEYGVALGTARHATAVLRERGLVITVAAKGTYVGDIP